MGRKNVNQENQVTTTGKSKNRQPQQHVVPQNAHRNIELLTPTNYPELIHTRLEQLEHLIAEIKKDLTDAPEGSLRINRHGEGCQYYYREKKQDRNGRYLKKSERNLAYCY